MVGRPPNIGGSIMAVSNSTDFNQFRNDIVMRALRIVGAYPQGGKPSAVQLSEGITALNSLIKHNQSQGMRLWSLEWLTKSFTASDLVIGTNGETYQCIRSHRSTAPSQPILNAEWTTYWAKKEGGGGINGWIIDHNYESIGDFILDDSLLGIDKAFIRSEQFDREVSGISIDRYMELPGKSNSGIPSHFVVMPERQLIVSGIPGEGYRMITRVYLWPQPDNTDITFHCQTIRKGADYDNVNNISDGDVRFLDAIVYGLAANLADEYGLPISERSWVAGKAEGLFYKSRLIDIEKVETYFEAI